MPMPLIVAELLKFGFSALAGAVASKGPELIQEKLGVDITSMVGSESGRIELKKLELQHEQFLINAAQASDARSLDYFKEEALDRRSARDMDQAITTSALTPWYRGMLMPAMAMLVTLGFFGCMGALFYVSISGTKLDDNSRDILIYAFGALTGGWMSILNYLFGSSRSSTLKDETFAKIVGR